MDKRKPWEKKVDAEIAISEARYARAEAAAAVVKAAREWREWDANPDKGEEVMRHLHISYDVLANVVDDYEKLLAGTDD